MPQINNDLLNYITFKMNEIKRYKELTILYGIDINQKLRDETEKELKEALYIFLQTN